MRKNAMAFLVVAVFVAGSAQAESSFKGWSERHSAAKKKLLNVLTSNDKFTDEFCACVEEDPEVMREYVEFLAAKGDRNTNDFVEKKGKDARLIRQCHQKYPEKIRAFREWIRDYSDAALELVKTKDGLKHMCKGGDVPEERRGDRKDERSDERRGDKKEVHDNRDGEKDVGNKKKKKKDD